jgi:WD40 repeat protein
MERMRKLPCPFQVRRSWLRKAMTESPSAEVRIRARRLATIQAEPQALLKGHAAEVQFLAFSPEGKLLASGSNDGTHKLWDVAARQEVATLIGKAPATK